MSDELEIAVCQRCGRGFVLTDTYRDYLARWGRQVIVPVLCPTCFLGAGPVAKEQGEVKRFSARKRYGFIARGEEDIFFHRRQLVDGPEVSPREGQSARFHVRYSPKGPEALNVEIEG